MTPPVPRYAAATPLPPYAFVPGHGLPHPVNDPRGHLFAGDRVAGGGPPAVPDGKSRVVTADVAAGPQWRYAIDLFNHGFYWEAHEAWEGVWHALGRSTPAARFVQGLIHLAAAAVKVREGKSEGVRRHAARARTLLAVGLGPEAGDTLPGGRGRPLGLVANSVADVAAELADHRPECWHTARAPVVRVLTGRIRLADAEGTGA